MAAYSRGWGLVVPGGDFLGGLGPSGLACALELRVGDLAKVTLVEAGRQRAPPKVGECVKGMSRPARKVQK